MKTAMSFIVLVVLGLASLAFATGKEEVAAKAQSAVSGIFREVNDESQPPKGHADLVIKTSIKAYPEGHFAFEKKPPVDGYSFVMNVDGQGILWKEEGRKEATSVYDSKGKRLPEGGKGTRYTLEKQIRLAPGTHTFFFGLPEENVSSEVTILLEEGTQNLIEFRPVYKKTHRGASGLTRDFAHGISKYEVFLNGKEISSAE